MEAHTFILQLLIILVAARVLGEIAASMVAPLVIGELAVGNPVARFISKSNTLSSAWCHGMKWN